LRYFKKKNKEIPMTGTIKNINKDKGYGFILGENGAEYFFHRSALKNITMDELEKGRQVAFEDAEGTKGPRAEDIFV
jgi:CspA family cold shock protein